jgi:DNA invertase Pin-like site-specific DNA recombinase
MGTAAYLRVSTSDQTVEHQRLQVTNAGIAPDRWFTDTASGRESADRPSRTQNRKVSPPGQ